ncbi:MAG: hypothetical protein ACYC0H_17415 [Solirubrobacteraceae bacterium]
MGLGEKILNLFRDAGVVQIITLSMSGVSLWVAVLAWRSSHRTSHRLVQIEEERDKREAKQASKARLTATMYEKRQYQYELLIHNEGDADARNVKLWLDGEPAAEQPAGDDVPSEKERLGAHGSLKFAFLPDLSTPLPRMIRIEWEDASGEKGLYESDL